ncbi:hypothetical protein ACHAQA_000021 [Verticillium albo-atrum]
MALAAPSGDSFFQTASDGQLPHDGTSDRRKQQHVQEGPSSIQPKRRGRPSKASLAKQDQSATSKAVALSPTAGRRSSASSIDSSLSEHADNPPSNSEKRTRLRARNREAAHKCRVRKQRGIEDLQTQEAAIGAVNQSLKDQYAELRHEVLLLKDMVLQHGGCGCSFIETYIEDAAASLSQKPNDFATSRHGSSGSTLSPASSWSPTTQGLAETPGFVPVEDETNNVSHFDWGIMDDTMGFHEGEQKESTLPTQIESYQGLQVHDHGQWMG